MIKYIESFCKSLGNYACYLFSLIDIAEKVTGSTFDVLKVVTDSISKGYVDFNFNDYNDTNNCYVNNPCAVLYMLTGKSWTVKKIVAPYTPIAGDYIIEAWHKDGNDNKDGSPILHFKRPENNSLQHSVSVEQGKIVSYRVFRMV